MPLASTILWFRQDLRLADHPALQACLKLKQPIIPLFIEDPNLDQQDSYATIGSASRWWLHHSLASLQQGLLQRGSRLVIRQGPSQQILQEVVEESQATHLCWNRCYEPTAIARDTLIKQNFSNSGLQIHSHNGALLAEPWEIQTKGATPYQVFTPFSRTLKTRPIAEPTAPPRQLLSPSHWPASLAIEDLKLLPTIKWDRGFYENWTPGETGADRELQRFINTAVPEYQAERDRPDHSGTSRLSPHLHFGEISPRQIWHQVCSALGEDPQYPSLAEPYLRQLIWREFGHHLLYHFPKTVNEPLRPDFRFFPWIDQPTQLRAWQQGLTGYPIVDAGMRELWHTGWMHNRIRMVTASFLVKDLRIAWQAGADWFWETLVDADLANNTLGWQWVAGCGADAAPYFRIFNPVSQGLKFDPEGTYVRRWVPELANLPNKWIHAPWEAPEEILLQSGIVLGKTYPLRLVDHNAARKIALESLQIMKQNTHLNLE